MTPGSEEAAGMIRIRSGLQAGDKVVASGQFLIDSESSLRAGFRRLATPSVEYEESLHRHQNTKPSQVPPDDHSLKQGSQAGRVSRGPLSASGHPRVTYHTPASLR